MFFKQKKYFSCLLFLFLQNTIYFQITNSAPILSAIGDQVYCPGTLMKIVTDFTITDSDGLGIDALYIQISNGYITAQDVLSLSGNHPTITSTWDVVSGKLTLSGSSGQPTYIALIAAVKDIT